MIIEKDGIKYNATVYIDRRDILQKEITDLEFNISKYTPIDTTGLTGTVLSIIKAENDKSNKINDSLITELESKREELLNLD